MVQRRPSTIRGFLYVLACPIVLFIAIVICVFIQWFMLLMPGVFELVFVLFKRGRRHLVEFGESALEHDKRPMVLFLREFGHENEIVEETSTTGRKTFEQTIVRLFRHLGPVVTIGNPEELLPVTGALRLYVEDNVWQERVLELFGRCRMVIIQANGRRKTMGLLWEIGQAFNHEPFKPVLLAFPFGYGGIYSERERYVNFKESFELVTGIDLPHETSQYLYFETRADPKTFSDPEKVLAFVDSKAQ